MRFSQFLRVCRSRSRDVGLRDRIRRVQVREKASRLPHV